MPAGGVLSLQAGMLFPIWFRYRVNEVDSERRNRFGTASSNP